MIIVRVISMSVRIFLSALPLRACV
jgi:hypothetical protein